MRSTKAGTPGRRTLVFLTAAFLLAAAAAAGLFLASCGSGPPTSTTTGQTTAASAPDTTAASPTTTATAPTTAPTAVPTTTGEAAIPLGEEAQIGEWKVMVVSATAPATELVAYTNEFNEPPPPGFDYVVVTVQATHTGEGSADFSLDMASAFVGSDGGEFGAPPRRAEPPQPIEEAGEAGPGETVSGDLVFEVSSAEMAGGTVRLAPASAPEAMLFFATG